MGIDIGASATTIGAAFDGVLLQGVYPQLGLGKGLAGLLDHIDILELTRWLTVEMSEEEVREHLLNKALFPATLPISTVDLDLEHAIARQAMRSALKLFSNRWPTTAEFSGQGLLPWVEPIVATGSVITKAPGPAHSALMLLDGLQPTGVTTLILDQNQIAASLGAIADINPVLTVQVLDTSSFLHLGTFISPVGNARPGTPVLKLKITYDNGHESVLEVKQGALEALPLPQGQSAKMQLQPLHRYDVGMGAPGRGGGLRVTGGVLGVVIDARGRPFSYPAELNRRREMVKKWLWTLGGR